LIFKVENILLTSIIFILLTHTDDLGMKRF